jgi:hypothetical protein
MGKRPHTSFILIIGLGLVLLAGCESSGPNNEQKTTAAEIKNATKTISAATRIIEIDGTSTAVTVVQTTKNAVATVVQSTGLGKENRPSAPPPNVVFSSFGGMEWLLLLWLAFCGAFLFDRVFRGLRNTKSLADMAFFMCFMVIGTVVAPIAITNLAYDASVWFKLGMLSVGLVGIYVSWMMYWRSFPASTVDEPAEQVLKGSIGLIVIGSIIVIVGYLSAYAEVFIRYYRQL